MKCIVGAVKTGLRSLSKIILLLLAILVVSTFSVSATTQEPYETFAFVNVIVIPMNTEHLLKNATVLIKKDKITQIGDSRKILVPKDAKTIDGRGLFLMPGLSDMHVHLGSEADMKLFLTNGVTTIRNMRGSPLHLYWREKIASGDILGPRIYTAGPILDGDPPTAENVVAVSTPEQARELVERQKKAGYDFIKVYTKLSPPVYEEILRAAKENEIPVAGHVPAAVGLRAALSSQQNCIEHLTGYLSAMKKKNPNSGHPEDKIVELEQIPLLAEKTRQAGVWNCVTLIVQKRFAAGNEIDLLLKMPEMKYVSPIRRAFWNPARDQYLKSLSKDDLDSAQEGIQVLMKVTQSLEKATAKLLLGTDAPSRFVIPGFSAHEELRNLVQSGLSPYEALQAATINAAEFVGHAGEFGTVEEGKSADLILLRGNPLKDISNTQKLAGVMVRGKWIPEQELHVMLAEVPSSFDYHGDRLFPASSPSKKEPEEFSARYQYTFDNLVVGEQRISVYKSPEGKRRIVTQVMNDSPISSLLSIETLEESASKRKIEFDSKRPEGQGHLEISEEGTAVKIRGKLPYQGDIDYQTELPEGSLFAMSELSSQIFLGEALREMKPGESSKLSIQELDFNECFNKGIYLMPVFWNVTRKEDEESRKVYAAEITTKYGTAKSTLVMDKEGYPFLWRRGPWQFKRMQ
jgi:imidazolonepropionase-like amidohydrolase